MYKKQNVKKHVPAARLPYPESQPSSLQLPLSLPLCVVVVVDVVTDITLTDVMEEKKEIERK